MEPNSPVESGLTGSGDRLATGKTDDCGVHGYGLNGSPTSELQDSSGLGACQVAPGHTFSLIGKITEVLVDRKLTTSV